MPRCETHGRESELAAGLVDTVEPAATIIERMVTGAVNTR
jgi:hypothetical protein